ncbi:MAG: hypothetical protein JWN99_2910 [Ilumatobacteraceae bacterium]|nr:hypothetical protein [Ilumatobacteraceae bacterium]
MTFVAELIVSSPVEPWIAIGLRVEDGRSWIGETCVRFVDVPPAGPSGLIGWTLLGSASRPDQIDGLATTYLDEIEPPEWPHPLGVTGIDHVVVMTSSVERTCGEIQRITGEPLKRIREAGAVRQGFHRFGPVIVEVVQNDMALTTDPEFWGFVLVVDDIYETAGALGPDVLSPPRRAVQQGRFIASFRTEVGLGLPVALMTPHVR